MTTSFQFNVASSSQKQISDLNDLNLNNYEEIYKFMYYIGSNLNARCNYSACLIEFLVDLPLITLIEP